MQTSKPHQSIRLFKNPVLESLSHVHPIVPLILWAPVVTYFLYQAFAHTALSALSVSFYALAGVVFWSLTEYLMHRFFFHYTAKTKIGERVIFLFHGNHHDDPQDPTRLVMPPGAGIPIATVFYFLFKWSLGAEACMPFFAGFLIGYLIYDYIHFAVHHFGMRSSWAAALKENHMKHHFMAKKGKWGVSSPVWDHVFGTFKQ